MSLLLGCIADDITGATDIALILKNQGMSVVQTLGVPSTDLMASADAVVVALKTRSVDPQSAIEASLKAVHWLKNLGAQQFYFKYCSTFDSSTDGNIGPVTEALLDYLKCDFTVVCPAFPINHRTVYQGHLFVGNQLLAESSMRNHPITPMRDSNLVRLLDEQTSLDAKIGLIPLDIVSEGANAIDKKITTLRESNHRFAVIDAVSNKHLYQIAKACSNLPLITGGSALSMGLADNYRRDNLLLENVDDFTFPNADGHVAILVGSCSSSTSAQIQHATQHYPLITIDPLAIANQSITVPALAKKALIELQKGSVIIASTTSKEIIEQTQLALGKESVSTLIEETFGLLAKALTEAGIQKIIVAGGETSGAVTNSLDIKQLRIGPQIDPGVPWTAHLCSPQLLLAFKSGNFGNQDFFVKAVEMMA